MSDFIPTRLAGQLRMQPPVLAIGVASPTGLSQTDFIVFDCTREGKSEIIVK